MSAMKKINFLTTLLILATLPMFAQKVIVVEHASGGSEAFARLDSAIIASQNGDVVYIPGGTYAIGTVVIDKGVHLVGVGVIPDSCAATGITMLAGTLKFVSGANNGSMTGIMLSNDVIFGTSPSNQYVERFTLFRCNFYNLYLSFDGTTQNNSSFLIKECIVRGNIHGGQSNAEFNNCFIEKDIYRLNAAKFKNNVIFSFYNNGNGYVLLNSEFINNIFLSASQFYSSSNYFFNNLFHGSLSTAGYKIGNLTSIPDTSIFVGGNLNYYDYTKNYHLKESSPGKNAGTDNTDIGVYGSTSPFKDGMLPPFPHIISRNIPAVTGANGKLNIEVKVNTQN